VRTGLDGFADDAAAWRRAAGARVPSYDRLLAAIVDMLESPELSARIAAAWASRSFVWQYDRPLLLLAALRLEALRAGGAHPLHAAIGAGEPRPEAITPEAVRAAFAPPWDAATLAALATRAVQTNETSRAAVWLWPAQLIGGDDGARPLALVDLGASAGLNLIADRLPAPWTAAGAPLPVVRGADVRMRVGLDLRPIDVRRDDDVAWLRACLWPGEHERRERLDQAIAAMRDALAGPEPPRLEAVDAAAMPARLAQLRAGLPADTVVLAYQTIFVDYLPADVRRAYEDGMARVIAGAQPGSMVWLTLELDADEPGVQRHPAALRATARGRDGAIASWTLARCGYHPREVEPDAAAVAAFCATASAGRPPSRR
jgi:hypothetical protein